MNARASLKKWLGPWFVRRRYFIAPRPQMRFAAAFVALVFVCQSALVAASYAYLRRSERITAETFHLSGPTRFVLLDGLRWGVLIVGAWVGLFSVVLTTWFVLRFSHRFYGPSVSIERFLKELGEGRYGGEIRLRRSDELRGIRDGLNALSRALKERHNP